VRRVARALTVALLGLAIGIGPTDAVTTWRTGTISRTAARELGNRIAAEHLRVCGRALVWDMQLRDVATWKAQDMGYHDTFSHRDEAGHVAWDFYARAGIPNAGGSAEIIAVNTWSVTDSPRVAFLGWMGSDSHRAAIRSCTYTRFGVGAFRTRDKKWYAAEFTRP
jgi:uncharacterized protein YkwD